MFMVFFCFKLKHLDITYKTLPQTMHIQDFKTKVMQSKGWLSAIVCCSMAKINDLWDGSMDKRKVRSLVPCCGQDGNLAQEPQHHRVIQHLTSCTYME